MEQKNCDCLLKLYTDLLHIVINGSLGEDRGVKQQLEKLLYQCKNKPLCLVGRDDVINKLAIAFKETSDPKRQELFLRVLNQPVLYFRATPEHVTFSKDHALLMLGIRAHSAPQIVLDDLIISINGFSPFLRFHFMLTNTHKPTKKEIATYIQSLRGQQ
jgi:hypothetical protein